MAASVAMSRRTQPLMLHGARRRQDLLLGGQCTAFALQPGHSLLSGWAPAAGHFYSGSLPQKATNGARVLSQVHDLGHGSLSAHA